MACIILQGGIALLMGQEGERRLLTRFSGGIGGADVAIGVVLAAQPAPLAGAGMRGIAVGPADVVVVLGTIGDG